MGKAIIDDILWYKSDFLLTLTIPNSSTLCKSYKFSVMPHCWRKEKVCIMWLKEKSIECSFFPLKKKTKPLKHKSSGRVNPLPFCCKNIAIIPWPTLVFRPPISYEFTTWPWACLSSYLIKLFWENGQVGMPELLERSAEFKNVIEMNKGFSQFRGHQPLAGGLTVAVVRR